MASNKEELEVLIDETGNITIHIHGIKGKSCVKNAEEIANNVGTIIQQSFTSEYYDPGQKVGITGNTQTKIND
ncbi:MAG: DUF2997 domain-containing protein [bacterium]